MKNNYYKKPKTFEEMLADFMKDSKKKNKEYSSRIQKKQGINKKKNDKSKNDKEK